MLGYFLLRRVLRPGGGQLVGLAVVRTNLYAAFYFIRAAAPAMKRQHFGRIVNISSGAGRTFSLTGIQAYASAKAGQIGLTRQIAIDTAESGITSNAVAPALIETEMLAGNEKASAERVPVGRLGTPEEVADVIVSVVRNPFITGQTLQVNGGIYMT